MVTLEQIKERFPEGCEVKCQYSLGDYGIVDYDSLVMHDSGDVYFINKNNLTIILHNSVNKEFATIITPTTKNQLSKYHVPCKGVTIDVYDVLKAFNVVNPATQHAIKKLLKGGERGFKDVNKDYQEAIESIERAIELNK
jgi:citrate lyase gamma subunit